MLNTATLSLWACFAATNLVSAQYLPDAPSLTVKELEHLYLDAGPNSPVTAITPCTKYVNPANGASSNSLGRQTAAEWIRTAFHDFITANIYTNTGGIDASIGFETNRPENVGSAFVDTLSFLSAYFSDKVSMADLIAFSTVLATAACGGPKVPLRGGRPDATAAGPSGVPEPETNLADTFNSFGQANFNNDDTITLTACGHTMGGVHHSIFPQVVPASAVSATNTDGRLPFDETVAGFDVGTVTDYINHSGDRGGPLVTTANKTVRSDLRLYTSDQNATMERLAQSNTYFQGQCADVFARMIDTVPIGVNLGNLVDPTTTTNVRPYDVELTVDWKGSMTLTGAFRYIQLAGTAAAPSTMSVGLVNRAGTTTKTTTSAARSAQDTGNGIWGPTNAFPFSLTFPATTGLSGVTAVGQTFSFQDTMFVVKGLSSISPAITASTFSPSTLNTAASYTVNTTVAYMYGKTTPPKTLTATFALPVPQSGTVSPKIDKSTTVSLAMVGKIGSTFAVYSAVHTFKVTPKQILGASIDVAVAGQTPGVMFYKPFDPLQ